MTSWSLPISNSLQCISTWCFSAIASNLTNPNCPYLKPLSQETILTIVSFCFDSLWVNPPKTTLANGKEALGLSSHVFYWHVCLGLVSATGSTVSWGPCCREVSPTTLSSAHSATGEVWSRSSAETRADGMEGPYCKFLLWPLWRVSFLCFVFENFQRIDWVAERFSLCPNFVSGAPLQRKNSVLWKFSGANNGSNGPNNKLGLNLHSFCFITFD